MVDVSGDVWMWGHPDKGQCGNNTDGKFLEKAGKESFDWVDAPTKLTLFVEKDPRSKAVTPLRNVKVKEIACGLNHTVVIDENYRAFSWGFGGKAIREIQQISRYNLYTTNTPAPLFHYMWNGISNA